MMKDRKRYLVKEGSAVFGWYYFTNKNQIEVYLYTTGYVGIFELSHIENIEDFVKALANKENYNFNADKLKYIRKKFNYGV